jgi:hypothetical protein
MRLAVRFDRDLFSSGWSRTEAAKIATVLGDPFDIFEPPVIETIEVPLELHGDMAAAGGRGHAWTCVDVRGRRAGCSGLAMR